MRNLIHDATPALLCTGPEPHYSDCPRVRPENATGPIRCAECGAPMIVIDILVKDREPSWSSLPTRGGHYYS